MKLLKIKQVLGLLALIGQLVAFAQSPMAEAKKINEWYNNKKAFQVNLNYLLYTDSTLKNPVEQHKGFFVRKGTNTYLNSLSTETMVNAQYQITVNHEQKILLASKNNSIDEPQFDQNQPLEIDGLLEKALKMKITKQSKTRQILTMFYQSGDYSQVKLVYNPITHQLLELHMAFSGTEGINWPYPDKIPYLVIKYYKVKVNHKVSATFFDEKKYIQVKNGQVKPAATLKTYQLFSTI